MGNVLLEIRILALWDETLEAFRGDMGDVKSEPLGAVSGGSTDPRGQAGAEAYTGTSEVAQRQLAHFENGFEGQRRRTI